MFLTNLLSTFRLRVQSRDAGGLQEGLPSPTRIQGVWQGEGGQVKEN